MSKCEFGEAMVSYLGKKADLGCKNFSIVVAPLTTFCSPAVSFVWTSECEEAFIAAKSLLCSAPALAAPNGTQAFNLKVDAYDEEEETKWWSDTSRWCR